MDKVADAYRNEAKILYDQFGRMSNVLTDDGVINVNVNNAGFVTDYSIENTGYTVQYEYNDEYALIGVNHNGSHYRISGNDSSDYSLTVNETTTSTRHDIRDDHIQLVHTNENARNSVGQVEYEYTEENQISKISYSNRVVVETGASERGVSDRDVSIINSDGVCNILRTNTSMHTVRNGNLEALYRVDYQIGDDEYTYHLNDKGMIDRILYNGEIIRYYEYDNVSGQLLLEDNYEINVRVTNSYDFFGNVLMRTSIDLLTGETNDVASYEYRNNGWKDQVTSFNGQMLHYDEYGNMLNLLNNTFSWNEDRLGCVQSERNSIYYAYNENGIRTSKTVNGAVTEYELHGRNVLSETSADKHITYMYDSENRLVGFTYNNENYLYKLNRFDDVVGIYNENLDIVVFYEYDAWGKIIEVRGELSDSIGRINPYRYRSYRYDEETNLYYLNNRYYSPELARFISADRYEGTVGNPLSHNLYAYCHNNPIMYIDPYG